MSGRSRLKIRPPRRDLHSANDVDFDTAWDTLRSAFQEIHDENASTLSYEEIYRYAYRLVLKKKGDNLYERVQAFEREFLCEKTKPEILGHLTAALSSFATDGDFVQIASMSSVARRMEGEAFLKAMQIKWDKHVQTINMLSDVLMYLDRAHCIEKRKPTVYQSAMNQFRDLILLAPVSSVNKAPNVMTTLNNIILDQIRMERADEFINRDPIRRCVWMLDSLSISSVDSADQKLYNVYFETAFLDSSRQFFQEEARLLLGESNAAQYCEKVTKRLEKEQARCDTMLMDTTRVKIAAVVEDELIKNKISEVIGMDNGVRSMVENDYLEDLNRIFRLERRVDRKATEFTKALQVWIEERGDEVNKAATVSLQTDPSLNSKDNEAAPAKDSESSGLSKQINQQTVSAIKWVSDVLALKEKFDKILALACDSNNEVQQALTRSFTTFVNHASFSRAAENVSLFIDDNMKRGIKDKTDAQIEEVLDKAIILLRYIDDKDMFEGYYKKHLAKRLLMSKSLSIDIEKSMVSRMKVDCGNNFTQKLEAMFKDMEISRELTADYRDYVKSQGDKKAIDLEMHVLTSMTWPDLTKGSSRGESGQSSLCKLPGELEELRKSFQNHYLQRHNGRKLDWYMHLGSADMYARFKRKYDINAPTYAMVVLCLFNDHDKLSFEEIEAETNIPRMELSRALQSLSVAPKTRLLKKEPMSRDVRPTDVFTVNENFVSKFIKIKIGLIAGATRVENEKERRATKNGVDDMRKHAIEAAIVRIMKQRKEQVHSQLVMETIEQLKQHFKPDVSMIKSRIDDLIEREYLERVADSDPSKYRYLA